MLTILSLFYVGLSNPLHCTIVSLQGNQTHVLWGTGQASVLCGHAQSLQERQAHPPTHRVPHKEAYFPSLQLNMNIATTTIPHNNNPLNSNHTLSSERHFLKLYPLPAPPTTWPQQLWTDSPLGQTTPISLCWPCSAGSRPGVQRILLTAAGDWEKVVWWLSLQTALANASAEGKSPCNARERAAILEAAVVSYMHGSREGPLPLSHENGSCCLLPAALGGQQGAERRLGLTSAHFPLPLPHSHPKQALCFPHLGLH